MASVGVTDLRVGADFFFFFILNEASTNVLGSTKIFFFLIFLCQRLFYQDSCSYFQAQHIFRKHFGSSRCIMVAGGVFV